MNILITGSTGWLGSRFLELIFDKKYSKYTKDWDVSCLVLAQDDLSSISEIVKRENIKLIKGDITKRETLAGALSGVDMVFHVAGLIHPGRIKELYEINTKGTQNLVTESEVAGVKKFIYISSNSVAGINKDNKPFIEEMSLKPYLNYGRSKYLAENEVNAAYKRGNMKTVILRPCWFYGPNQPKRQTTFFKMISKGNPIIFGNGLNLRSMSYVDNTCQAMFLAANNSNADGQTYWVSDAQPYKTLDIYGTVAKILKVKKFKPRHLPDIVSFGCFVADILLQSVGLYIKEIHVAGEMNKNIFCSNEKAIKELGYNPDISLEEGMTRSIKWCRDKGLL
jgi:nucleoside-diphosphate-sugar epimerase